MYDDDDDVREKLPFLSITLFLSLLTHYVMSLSTRNKEKSITFSLGTMSC